MQLPPFNDDGLLPVGDYLVTLDELKHSPLVTGEGVGLSNWDALWRLRLVLHLEALVEQLWQVGIDRIFIDGSFVEEKSHPNDIDGYFECTARDLLSLTPALNALDPYKVWTWDLSTRRPHPDSAKPELPMWHRYRVELFPEYGQLSGIRDEYGNPQVFPAAFRKRTHTYQPKGIVQIIR